MVKKIIISVLILFALTFLYYQFTHKKGRLLTERDLQEYYSFLCPPENDYAICILEDNKIVPVTDRNWLTCGSKVSVSFKLNFTDKNYFLCSNRDKLIGGSSEAPKAYNYDNGSKVFSCEFPNPPVGGIFYEWGSFLKGQEILNSSKFMPLRKN